MKTKQGFFGFAVLVAAALFVFAGCGDAEGGPTGGPPPDQAATPEASPSAGEVASGTQITLSTATEGASIYYTLDGAAPTTDSILYADGAKPSITEAKTLKAIAVKSGMDNSEVLEAAYTVNVNKVATPAADPPAGVVLTGTEITLSTDTEGASIYYTLDGAAPTTDSTLYSDDAKPSITEAKTLKAIAVKDGMDNSEVLEAEYRIADKAATPLADPPAGVVLTGTAITLSTTTEGASIYYAIMPLRKQSASTNISPGECKIHHF